MNRLRDPFYDVRASTPGRATTTNAQTFPPSHDHIILPTPSPEYIPPNVRIRLDEQSLQSIRKIVRDEVRRLLEENETPLVPVVSGEEFEQVMEKVRQS